jgi:hypothetical protein
VVACGVGVKKETRSVRPRIGINSLGDGFLQNPQGVPRCTIIGFALRVGLKALPLSFLWSYSEIVREALAFFSGAPSTAVPLIAVLIGEC